MARVRLNWQAVLEHAADVVRSYDTGVTLRQLFYRLVSDGTLRNTQSQYNSLSANTAKARREGWFPPLVDNTRQIHRVLHFDDTPDAIQWLTDIYRLNRTRGQDINIYIGVEKDGLTTLLRDWFEDYGVRVLALRGYSSQTFVDTIKRDVRLDGRYSILIYGGDYDPSGEDIQRDFEKRTDCFDEIIRVALTPEQVERYNLPEYPGKATDSRAKGFRKRHGKLVQVELDALPPDVLKLLYEEEFFGYFDLEMWDTVVKDEEKDIEKLKQWSHYAKQ